MKVSIPASVSKLAKSEIKANNKKVPNNQALTKIKKDATDFFKELTDSIKNNFKSFFNNYFNELNDFFKELNKEKIKYTVKTNSDNSFHNYQVYEELTIFIQFYVEIDEKDEEMFESILKDFSAFESLSKEESANKITYYIEGNVNLFPNEI